MNIVIKLLLWTYCCTYRPVPLSVLIREASSCGRWQLTKGTQQGSSSLVPVWITGLWIPVPSQCVPRWCALPPESGTSEDETLLPNLFMSPHLMDQEIRKKKRRLTWISPKTQFPTHPELFQNKYSTLSDKFTVNTKQNSILMPCVGTRPSRVKMCLCTGS